MMYEDPAPGAQEKFPTRILKIHPTPAYKLDTDGPSRQRRNRASWRWRNLLLSQR